MRWRSQAAGTAPHRSMLGLRGLLAEKTREMPRHRSIRRIGKSDFRQAHLSPLRHVLAGHAGQKSLAQDSVDILSQQFRFDGAADKPGSAAEERDRMLAFLVVLFEKFFFR